ncbi:DCN1-like protein 3 [Halichondria panicea]|uniref:DCN1-like protein 3 n=1 Tax=Halichondria panicea TaxID=6063 RepID=UPI00312B3D4A
MGHSQSRNQSDNSVKTRGTKQKSSKDKHRRSQPLPPSSSSSPDKTPANLTRASSLTQASSSPRTPPQSSLKQEKPTATRSGTDRIVPARQFPPSIGGQGNGNKHSQIEKYFTKYKDAGEDAILADGMEKFCVDLGVEPTEFIVLVLAWKFEASQMCRFTREEFVNGCQKLRVHDAKSLKERFPELSAEAKNERNFKDLYNFTFSFGLDHSTGQRSLPIDMAVPLWDLVFSLKRPEVLNRWFEFLKLNQIRGISRDTWNMFLPFVETILPDMTNYDESEAWPSLFDDFVEAELEK